MKKLLRLPAVTLSAMALLFVAGCANHPMPATEEALAKQEIDRAKSGQAYRYAPARIKEAEAKFVRAEELIDRQEYLEAKFLLEQSRKDAEEAYAVSQSEEAKALLDEVKKTLQELENTTMGS